MVISPFYYYLLGNSTFRISNSNFPDIDGVTNFYMLNYTEISKPST